MSAVDGTLALHTAGAQWTDSGVNDPVAPGMSVRTAAQGHAILRMGTETIALSDTTELDLGQFDAGGTRIVLHRGRIGVRLAPPPFALTAGPGIGPAPRIEIDIPRGKIWLLTPGDYDIAAGDEHLPARIASRDGRARFIGKGIDTVIAAGATSVLDGSDPVVASVDGPAGGDFVTWRPAGSEDGDHEALRYVSAEMTGYAALNGNGTWETVDGYGAVWFPQTLPDDWAPYRDGHWRWVPPWGWTWIDDMPWGFVTSHYGRWARIAGSDTGTGRWGWVPGSRVAHPVYAPALVAFLGTAGVGLSYPDAAGPAVGWFPLAPGETYWPGYTSDLAAIRRINDGSVDDISAIGPAVNGQPPADIVNGDYKNRRFARVVPRAVFIGGRPVLPSLLHLPATRLANAPLLAGSPQLGPPAPRPVTTASAAGAAGRVAAAPASRWAGAIHRLARVVARHGPTAIRPAILVRAAHARARVAFALARQPLRHGTHLARPRLVAAVGSPVRHQRLRLAAAHRQ